MRSNVTANIVAGIVMMFSIPDSNAHASAEIKPQASMVSSQLEFDRSIYSQEAASKAFPVNESTHHMPSDTLLTLLAALALVVLQLRRQQKASANTRIIGNIELNGLNLRSFRETQVQAQLQSGINTELMAYPERG